jgi:hypothetical protein
MWSSELPGDNAIAGDNFTILPDGRKNALDLALNTFPELKDRFDGPDEEFAEDVYFVYDLLSSEMVRRWSDEPFRKRSCDFLDRLAESGDPLLEELLVVCLLEKVAEDSTISEQAKACVGEKAGGFLRRVEREMFGR